jgi:hypothetical protein
MRHRVDLPYGIEGWVPAPPRWVRALGEIAWWLGSIGLGMGIGWLLMVLHGAGVTP